MEEDASDAGMETTKLVNSQHENGINRGHSAYQYGFFNANVVAIAHSEYLVSVS